MAGLNGTAFPRKNQAYTVPLSFPATTAGLLVTGWITPACVIYIDGTLYGSPPTPVEIGSTGIGYIDLTNAMMNGNTISIYAQIANVSGLGTLNSGYGQLITIHPVDLTDAGAGTREIMLERMVAANYRKWFNDQQVVQTGGNTNQITIYKDPPNGLSGGAVPFFTETVTVSPPNSTRTSPV